jgi:thiol-disulfide isomerase/thioredoxin
VKKWVVIMWSISVAALAAVSFKAYDTITNEYTVGPSHELEGLTSDDWLNSRPIALSDLRGKVVLLHFWTYGCGNCQRTLPRVQAMWEKYGNSGLVVIGIHTPEFDSEKNPTNVRKAIESYGLTYPQANDPGRINWINYGGAYWPRAVVIDAEGRVVLNHIGELGYDNIEQTIKQELAKQRLE